MSNKAIIELTKAESLLNNWKWLPGSQVKMLISHLIRSIDAVTSYMINKETTLEKSYLLLSSYRLFQNKKTESNFYETYFHLKNLLMNDIQRFNEESFKIKNYKNEQKVSKEYFEELINNVKTIINNVLNT